jgi:signal transduction histidine kinase
VFLTSVQRTNLGQYAFAVLLALLAVVLTGSTTSWFGGRAALPLVTLAVTLVASYAGFGPGILTSCLSVACLGLMFTGSIFRLVQDRPNLWLLGGLGIAISAIIENVGRRNRALVIARDLLAIANLERDQRSALLVLSNDELKRFVYALSHDLKTPLRSVSLFTEQLADSMGHKLDADSETSLQFIRQGARQAQDMIHRLLQYAMAANHDRVETATDLEDALAGALGDLQNSARETNATITNDPLPVVQGDGDSLRQLLLNLLANAIKYRGKEAPEIHVAARDAGTEWIISVRDNGIGINPHYAGKVFELFERLHSASEYEGSGIGLSICRRIVQRHGGRIWFESELGHGCTFYFTLPIVQISRESAAPLKTTSTSPRLVASSEA